MLESWDGFPSTVKDHPVNEGAEYCLQLDEGTSKKERLNSTSGLLLGLIGTQKIKVSRSRRELFQEET